MTVIPAQEKHKQPNAWGSLAVESASSSQEKDCPRQGWEPQVLLWPLQLHMKLHTQTQRENIRRQGDQIMFKNYLSEPFMEQ